MSEITYKSRSVGATTFDRAKRGDIDTIKQLHQMVGTLPRNRPIWRWVGGKCVKSYRCPFTGDATDSQFAVPIVLD